MTDNLKSEKEAEKTTLDMCFHFGGHEEARVWISQESASMGIAIGGSVIWKSVAQWHKLAWDYNREAE